MIDHIRPAQLADWLASLAATDKPVVLDVREPWELQTAAIKANGFTLLAIPMNDIPSRMGELDAKQPTACLCHHGARSLRVANFLSQNGFDKVVNISGGIEVWAQELDTSVPRY